MIDSYKFVTNCLWLALTVLLVLTSANAGTLPDSRTDTVILQLRWFHQFQFAGYYAAIEQGYYSDAGLNVVLKEVTLGMDTTEEVITGRAQYGVCVTNIVLQRNMGKPVVVLAAIYQHSPLILLSRKETGILSPHDLIGRRVMIRRPDDAQTMAMILNEGISLDQIDIVEHTFNYNDLIQGKIDAASAFVTSQPYLLEEQGIAYSYLRPISYGIDFYGDCLFTSEYELKEHPERVKAFRDASLKGWAYAMDHKEEIIQLITSRYNSKISLAGLRYEAKKMEEIILPRFVEIGHMNPLRWEHIADIYARTGLLAPDYSIEGMIYNPEPEAESIWIRWALAVLLIAVVIISLGALFLFLFNRRLKTSVQKRTCELSALNEKLFAEINERKMTEVQLNSYKQHLEELVNARTRDLKKEIDDRKQAESHIHTLTHQLIKAQENERQMISRELHDSVAQDLSWLKIACESLWDNPLMPVPQFLQKNSKFYTVLTTSIQSVRNLSYELRPPELDEIGLVRAVRAYCDDFGKTSSVSVEFVAAGMESLALDFDIEINLYRLVQEALNNIRKHADAKQVSIKLVAVFPNIILRIEDDGKGFDLDGRLTDMLNEKRMGIQSMRERVNLLKGKIRIKSRPGKGTKIFIEVPYAEENCYPY